MVPGWEAFCGDGLERLCREALPEIYLTEGVNRRFEVGEYWDRAVQIDIVGLREDGRVDLGECRWSAGARLTEVTRELEARAQRFPAGGLTVRHRVFLRRRPRTVPSNVTVHDLGKLYGELPTRAS